MSAYAIGEYGFETWDGPAPIIPTRKMLVHRRPGVSGVSHQVLGTWGDTFQVTLTSHHASQLEAATRYDKLRGYIGVGGFYVRYNYLAWSGLHGVLYNVDDWQLVGIESRLRIIDLAQSYVAGAVLKTIVTLTPQAKV